MRYERNKKTISGRLHDEIIMMDMEQGKYFSLNSTATAIWELLDKPLSAEELCDRLAEEYEVEKEKCIEDVNAILTEMKALGLIKLTEE